MVPQFLGQVPSRVGRPVLSTPGSQAAPGGGMLLILGTRFGTWCILKGIVGKASVEARLPPCQAAGGSPSWAWCVSNLSVERDDSVFPLQRLSSEGGCRARA